MSEQELGHDRWLLESELASLEDDLRTDPTDGLPDLLDLAERALALSATDPAAPEVAGALDDARQLVRVAEGGGDVPNDAAFAAVALLRELIRSIAEQGVPPVRTALDPDAGAEPRPHT